MHEQLSIPEIDDQIIHQPSLLAGLAIELANKEE